MRAFWRLFGLFLALAVVVALPFLIWGDAFGQSGQIKEDDWLKPPPVDQRTVYEGNSILRGGREPRVEEPKAKRPVEELVIE